MTEMLALTADWISPPGDTIEDLLEERRWHRVEFAQRLGFSAKHVNDLVQGRAPITPETASKLATVLGSTTQFWLAREANYQAALERKRAKSALAGQVDWLQELPVAWMVEQGWIPKLADKIARVQALLSWFGVASVDAWRDRWATPLAAFRASEKFEKRLGAVAAWLCAAERGGAAISCAPFSHDAFQAALAEIRKLANEPSPAVFVPKLKELCARCGVAVVFVPAPPGCPAHGATRWLTSDKALLALSLRYKSNDQLWFSFFHEAGHLLKHGKRLLIIEGIAGLDEAREAEANAFAADTLIPRKLLKDLSSLRSEAQVRQAAASIGVAPGIIVGRMQHEGWLPRTHLNHLKMRYEWVKRETSAD